MSVMPPMPTETAPSLLEKPLSQAELLQRDGLVILPNFVAAEQLAQMQRAFAQHLQHQRWNDMDGYEKTDRNFLMVQDLLTLDQGFVDAALHPIIKGTLRTYLGPGFELVEARGWLTKPMRDFHGWHVDPWNGPRECKLGIYLTDVGSGGFKFVKESHGKQAPRTYKNQELANIPAERIVEVVGPAGTAILYDTSGIHCQASSSRESVREVSLGYRDPSVPLRQEDAASQRPLLLNAAFLGGLGQEEQRILGFGNKNNCRPEVPRQTPHGCWQWLMESCFSCKLFVDGLRHRIVARMRRRQRN